MRRDARNILIQLSVLERHASRFVRKQTTRTETRHRLPPTVIVMENGEYWIFSSTTHTTDGCTSRFLFIVFSVSLLHIDTHRMRLRWGLGFGRINGMTLISWIVGLGFGRPVYNGQRRPYNSPAKIHGTFPLGIN